MLFLVKNWSMITWCLASCAIVCTIVHGAASTLGQLLLADHASALWYRIAS